MITLLFMLVLTCVSADPNAHTYVSEGYMTLGTGAIQYSMGETVFSVKRGYHPYQRFYTTHPATLTVSPRLIGTPLGGRDILADAVQLKNHLIFIDELIDLGMSHLLSHYYIAQTTFDGQTAFSCQAIYNLAVMVEEVADENGEITTFTRPAGTFIPFADTITMQPLEAGGDYYCVPLNEFGVNTVITFEFRATGFVRTVLQTQRFPLSQFEAELKLYGMEQLHDVEPVWMHSRSPTLVFETPVEAPPANIALAIAAIVVGTVGATVGAGIGGAALARQNRQDDRIDANLDFASANSEVSMMIIDQTTGVVTTVNRNIMQISEVSRRTAQNELAIANTAGEVTRVFAERGIMERALSKKRRKRATVCPVRSGLPSTDPLNRLYDITCEENYDCGEESICCPHTDVDSSFCFKLNDAITSPQLAAAATLAAVTYYTPQQLQTAGQRPRNMHGIVYGVPPINCPEGISSLECMQTASDPAEGRVKRQTDRTNCVYLLDQQGADVRTTDCLRMSGRGALQVRGTFAFVSGISTITCQNGDPTVIEDARVHLLSGCRIQTADGRVDITLDGRGQIEVYAGLNPVQGQGAMTGQVICVVDICDFALAGFDIDTSEAERAQRRADNRRRGRGRANLNLLWLLLLLIPIIGVLLWMWKTNKFTKVREWYDDKIGDYRARTHAQQAMAARDRYGDVEQPRQPGAGRPDQMYDNPVYEYAVPAKVNPHYAKQI